MAQREAAIVSAEKPHIFPRDNDSKRCSTSSPWARPSGSSPPTQRTTLLAISRTISSPEMPCATSILFRWSGGSPRRLLADELQGRWQTSSGESSPDDTVHSLCGSGCLAVIDDE
jgi:hypothetical protein